MKRSLTILQLLISTRSVFNRVKSFVMSLVTEMNSQHEPIKNVRLGRAQNATEPTDPH